MIRYPRDVIRWTKSAERCMLCWCPVAEILRTQVCQFGPIERAHIVSRSKCDCNERFNLVLSCPRCHRCERGPKDPGWPDIGTAEFLYVKLTEDRGHWDPDRLEELFHRRLPHEQPLPERFWEERAIWQPNDYRVIQAIGA